MDDPMLCESCGLRWGPAGSHPPCLKLDPEERRAIYDEIRKTPVKQELPAG